MESLRTEMNQHWLELLLVLMLAALQPVVPMKFVTWAAGIVGVPVIPFLVCILLGRGKRVWLLALLIRLFGERAERILHKPYRMDRLGCPGRAGRARGVVGTEALAPGDHLRPAA